MRNKIGNKKACAKQILRFFTIPYKGKSVKSLKSTLPKYSRNACEQIFYNKFQLYSLQMK